MFEIRYDDKSHLLRIHMSGFWTPAIFDDFSKSFSRHIDELKRQNTRFAIINDCRDYPVQSPQVGAVWLDFLTRSETIEVPFAVVVGSALNKIQSTRVLDMVNLQNTQSSIRIFATMDLALDWLRQVFRA